MKDSQTAQADIANAFRLLGRTPPESDGEIRHFLNQLDSGELDVPEIPEHLSPKNIIEAIRKGRPPFPVNVEYVPFGSCDSAKGSFERMRIAARNGDGPLSEETLRKMEEAQED